MRKEQDALTAHLDADNLDSGVLFLKLHAADVTLTPCAFVRVKFIKQFLESILNNLTDIITNGGFDGYIWLLFSGDKGVSCEISCRNCQ